MFKELDNLTPISAVKMNDIKQVIDAVNRRLAMPLNAHVIRVYLREDSEKGVILNPIAYINDTQEQDPKIFELYDKPGPLSWVYRNNKPIWFEKLNSRDLKENVMNKATDENIDVNDLQYFRYKSDSMIIIPLICKSGVIGIYAVELPFSERFNNNILHLINRLCKYIAALVENADSYERQHSQASIAITEFLNKVRNYSFDNMLNIEDVRTGFIARPFDKDYAPLEENIVKLFKERKIKVRSYEPQKTNKIVIDEIQEQIKNSHFCIADITGANPNVLAEVGMMMILKKNVLLLRHNDDQTKCPFDIAAYPIHNYEINQSDGLRTWSIADDGFIPFKNILDTFINNLPHNEGFFAAKEFID